MGNFLYFGRDLTPEEVVTVQRAAQAIDARMQESWPDGTGADSIRTALDLITRPHGMRVTAIEMEGTSITDVKLTFIGSG